jgi:hypothetical protein
MYYKVIEGRSNTDSGSKRGVQCRNTTTIYLVYIIKNLFLFNITFIF